MRHRRDEKRKEEGHKPGAVLRLWPTTIIFPNVHGLLWDRGGGCACVIGSSRIETYAKCAWSSLNDVGEGAPAS